jgi:hypothetical protein
MSKRPATEILPNILQQVYNELRWYRNTEHRTFAFWSAMLIGSLLVDPDKIPNPPFMACLLTAGSVLITYYLIRNQYRMAKLRNTIVAIQDEYEEINEKHLRLLTPRRWITYSWYRFLDTMLYLVMLWSVTVVFWIMRVLLK